MKAAEIKMKTNNAMGARFLGTIVLAAMTYFGAGCASSGEPTGKVYPTPDEALRDVAASAGQGDQAKVEEIFGKGATDVLWSGDPVQDREDGLRIKTMLEEKVEIVDVDANSKIAYLGADRWPMPIPLVRGDAGWGFDLAAGKEEILNRRIGRNELMAIETLHAYVDAQREYAAAGRDGNPQAFAQKIRSADGRHDGLYWATAAGEAPSPFGPLVAGAEAEGYRSSDSDAPAFHGYRFRILTRQGENAPGGKKDYVVNGLMTGGFAAVAWPANYGNSGVKCFIVDRLGIVYEKDLGANGESIMDYNPDDTWTPVEDTATDG